MEKKEEWMISEGNSETAAYIRQRLVEYNRSHAPGKGSTELEQVSLVLKNDAGEIVGGINATINSFWGMCHVDIFWLDDSVRGQGRGSELLRKVEGLAKERGCHMMQLDTFSFQAPEFYQKQGYEVFGVLEDYPKGHKRYFYKKNLA